MGRLLTVGASGGDVRTPAQPTHPQSVAAPRGSPRRPPPANAPPKPATPAERGSALPPGAPGPRLPMCRPASRRRGPVSAKTTPGDPGSGQTLLDCERGPTQPRGDGTPAIPHERAEPPPPPDPACLAWRGMAHGCHISSSHRREDDALARMGPHDPRVQCSQLASRLFCPKVAPEAERWQGRPGPPERGTGLSPPRGVLFGCSVIDCGTVLVWNMQGLTGPLGVLFLEYGYPRVRSF